MGRRHSGRGRSCNPRSLHRRLGAREQAGFKAQDAGDRATAAKEAYKAGLRLLDYDI
jgi:hypothetical protein